MTVDFHEGRFLGKVNGENKAPFWFQLDGRGRQQVGSPWGPVNTQALNRYSYVQNNPLKWIDPTGHFGVTIHGDNRITFHLNHQEANALLDFMLHSAFTYIGWFKDMLGSVARTSAQTALDSIKQLLVNHGGLGGAILAEIIGMIGAALIAGGATAGAIIGTAIIILTTIGIGLSLIDWLGGKQGIDITLFDWTATATGGIKVGLPTVERQQGVWRGDIRVCEKVSTECVLRAIGRP